MRTARGGGRLKDPRVRVAPMRPIFARKVKSGHLIRESHRMVCYGWGVMHKRWHGVAAHGRRRGRSDVGVVALSQARVLCRRVQSGPRASGRFRDSTQVRVRIERTDTRRSRVGTGVGAMPNMSWVKGYLGSWLSPVDGGYPMMESKGFMGGGGPVRVLSFVMFKRSGGS
jgi:hypothetical protein